MTIDVCNIIQKFIITLPGTCDYILRDLSSDFAIFNAVTRIIVAVAASRRGGADVDQALSDQCELVSTSS